MATATKTLDVKCSNNVQSFLYAKINSLLAITSDGKDSNATWAHIEHSLTCDGIMAGLSDKVAGILARVAIKNYRAHLNV